MIVGCKLPHGHTIEFNDRVIVLNGGNVGFDPNSPWRQDHAPDAEARVSGVGLTTLTGADAEAFKAWYDIHKGGGPIAAGVIFYTEAAADAKKEARAREKVKTSVDGLDPTKDLPKGLETAAEA